MARKSKPTRAAKKSVAAPVREHSKNVNIRKAQNGFVVSSFSDGEDKTMIAKTKSEAKKIAEKMLGV